MNHTLTTEKQNPSLPAAEEAPGLIPLVDIAEDKEAYTLVAEMPGVTRQNLEILLENHELTIIGRRNWAAPEGAELLVRETKPRHFRRVFELDPAVDSARIEARMEQGVLTLTLPKTEQVKPRKIAVS